MIMRAYTFTNYAGRFLYVEAHNKAHHDTSGPAMSLGPTPVPTACSATRSASSNSSISPDGGDAGIGGNKVVDGDAASDALHVPPRAWSPCAATTRTCRPSQITVRVADATGNNDTSSVTEWAGRGCPPRVAKFQKDFITKYMDPTETYGRMDSLTAQFPDIVAGDPLPNKTDGYQRPGMAMMAGTTHGQREPERGQHAARGAAVLEGDGPSRRQQHHRRVQEPAARRTRRCRSR